MGVQMLHRWLVNNTESKTFKAKKKQNKVKNQECQRNTILYTLALNQMVMHVFYPWLRVHRTFCCVTIIIKNARDSRSTLYF